MKTTLLVAMASTMLAGCDQISSHFGGAASETPAPSQHEVVQAREEALVLRVEQQKVALRATLQEKLWPTFKRATQELKESKRVLVSQHGIASKVIPDKGVTFYETIPVLDAATAAQEKDRLTKRAQFLDSAETALWEAEREATDLELRIEGVRNEHDLTGLTRAVKQLADSMVRGLEKIEAVKQLEDESWKK